MEEQEEKTKRKWKRMGLSPDDQKPTVEVPKKINSNGLNTYFLERGDPFKNGSSSGMTPFNQT